MALNDGLDIAQDSNSGEAVILPQSTFDPVSFSRHALDMQMASHARKRFEDAKRHNEIAKWANQNDPVQKWDTDKINYFVPKLDELRKKESELLKKYNGVPPAKEMFALNNEREKLKSESDMSNAQYDQFTKAFTESKTVDNNQKPKYDPSSIEGVNYYSQPKEFKNKSIVNAQGEQTTVGKELEKYGNDVFKFRAANQHLLHLEPNWHYIDRVEDILKGDVVKPSTAVEMANIGGKRGTVTATAYTPEQISQVGQTLYGENPDKFSKQVNEHVLNNLSDKEHSEFVQHALQKKGIIDKDGKENPEFTAMPPEQKRAIVQKATATEGFDVWFNKLHPKSKGQFNEFNKDAAGTGKSFEDRFSVAVVPTPTTGGDYLDFNKKYKTNYSADEFNAIKLAGQGGNYVAIEPKTGKADNESLQLNINGRQVRPIGYTVKDGKVLMTISEGVPVEEGVDPFGKPIIKYKYKVSKGIPVDGEIAGNVAAHYGFGTFDEFKSMLDKKISKTGAPSSNNTTGTGKWSKYKRN